MREEPVAALEGTNGYGQRVPAVDQATRILFADTWRMNKGIQDLVPAFCALLGRCPDVSLTMK